MQVIRFLPPGGPEKLVQETAPIPSNLAHGELLIKVHAASVLWTELTWPVYQSGDGSYVPHVPCHDFAGVVESVGPGCEASEITEGSEVCVFTTEFTSQGHRKYEGALAEYTVADLKSTVLKPKNLSFAEAASVPLSALTAWQALNDQAQLQKGQRLLVTGAAGATGLWAVQFAKQIGAYVIGTASSDWSFNTLKELGVDEFIDYKSQKLSEAISSPVDLVLDTVGGDENREQISKVVKQGGTGAVVSIADFGISSILPKELNAKFFIVSMNREHLLRIMEMLANGELRKPCIDSIFPLKKAAEAFRKGENGHLQGKVMVEVSSA